MGEATLAGKLSASSCHVVAAGHSMWESQRQLITSHTVSCNSMQEGFGAAHAQATHLRPTYASCWIT